MNRKRLGMAMKVLSATSFNHIRSDLIVGRDSFAALQTLNWCAFRSPKTETTDDIIIVYCTFDHPQQQVREIS